jgi:CRISPR-associated endonuclease Csn1
MAEMRYRLALDLGATSLGWAMVRLNSDNRPCAVIRAGVRIFSDGRNPKDGASLAVSRRDARAMRRRRDRLLKRKARLMRLLIEHGFFPRDTAERKALERLDPYFLRAEGLDRPLSAGEFARALFHLNQRRGFKSNRKADSKDNDGGALKTAISKLRATLLEENCRTVGEWLSRRRQHGMTVRARFRQTRIPKDDGKTRIDKSYDFYVDRAMIAEEFDRLWARQRQFDPLQFNDTAHDSLRDALLYQRALRPVVPGRCTLIPDQPRAPLALPSTQRFRIYQEVNNLRVVDAGLNEQPLSLAQRNLVIDALEHHGKRSFTALRSLLGLPSSTRFNLEDAKRQELKGNATSAVLARKSLFGADWFKFNDQTQDAIVRHLLDEEDTGKLIAWLSATTQVDDSTAEQIANASLPDGYGSLSEIALNRILPELQRDVVSYAEAAKRAGFHHSRLSENAAVEGRTFPTEFVQADTGEITTFHRFTELPYYGEFLQRHVGFADPRATPTDPPEKRFGRIANPTVHIGLNQVRTVVNALLARYGHPAEVIVEVARDLKMSQREKKEESERQAANQKRNYRFRDTVAEALGVLPVNVKRRDIDKLILWEELSYDAADRRCPYSGVQISLGMLLSDQVEIEHILPFSDTLDDSLGNKTVALRAANRVKGNRSPWTAREDFARQGWGYEDILARAAGMPRSKRQRFAEDGYQRWLRDDKDFLARALNDTRYLSRVAREYLSLICPQDTRVIPGRMTAMLRAKFGLNDVLGLNGEKNRNDHRHHAVDACVIAVTDQGMLQSFARASASARQASLDRLVDNMPLPWPLYRDHVQRAVRAIWVSHRPDHGYEGRMHNDTAYGLLGDGRVRVHKDVEGRRVPEEKALKVIPIAAPGASARHGQLHDGSPRPYKGYDPNSNYCLEVVRTSTGKWRCEVVSTFSAYQLARAGQAAKLRDKVLSVSGQPLVMRLILNDVMRLDVDGRSRTLRVATIEAKGRVLLADIHEANVDARNRSSDDSFAYVSKMGDSLRTARARKVTISPIGEVRDHGPVD